MSDTYIGWDGKDYPWPPPDGWYQASDSRWWAPGTGPNPPPTGSSGAPSAFEATAPPGQRSAHDPTGAAATPFAGGEAATSQMPSYGSQPDPGAGAAPSAGASAGAFSSAGPTQAGVPPFNPSVERTADLGQGAAISDHQPSGPGPVGVDTPPPSGGGSRLGRLGLVLAGSLAAVAVAAGAYFFLVRDDGTDTATDEAAGSETATDDGADTTTEDNAADDPADDADGSGPAEESADDGTAADSTTTTEDEDDETTTTEDDAAEDEDEDDTTTTANSTAEVAEFRELLTDAGLTSEGITEEEIVTFGTTFCVFAVASSDRGEYEDFRQQAVEDTTSSLTDAELFEVIDAAVIVFCPDEAERLGLT